MIERLHDRCAEYGVRVRFDDLGSWSEAVELRAEYDPAIPEIVVSCRLAPRLVAHAIAHELYHHREAIGDVPRMPTRRERERAADAHAKRLLAELR
jgi:hypothetical protein